LDKIKIALVGTTNLSEDQQQNMRQHISLILKKYSLDVMIISGGAKGVDTLAIEIAKNMGFQTKVYTPQREEWKYYKKRNLQIANDCDELYCFSTCVQKQKCYHHDTLQNHEKTAGCWTGNKVMNMNKSFHLIVIPNR